MNPSETESMSLHQLGLSTDFAPLLRAAREQNWIVRKSPTGHIKWIPPKGQAVHTSGSPSDVNACHQVRRDLVRAGLKLGDDIPNPKPSADIPLSTESQPKGKRRKGLIWDIEQILRDANRPTHVDDIKMRLSIKYPGIEKPEFLPSLSKLLAKGYIVRREMGVYQHKSEQITAPEPATPTPWPGSNPNKRNDDEPPLGPLPPGPIPTVEPTLAPLPPGPMDPEEVIIDRALQALADLEGLLRKMKRRTAQYRKLKALLDSVEVDGE